MGDSRRADPAPIERSVPRALFSELLAGALHGARIQPSPMATAYLIELLDERVFGSHDGLEGAETLAEALLAARQDCGMARIRRMRGLGDHALFVSGFLADSLARSAVDANYYRQIGCSAYVDVVSGLRGQGEAGTWTRLYAELSQRFGEFVDLLSEVGDQTRPGRRRNLLSVYERYLRSGSAQDRDRLIRNGLLPPDRAGLRWWQ